MFDRKKYMQKHYQENKSRYRESQIINRRRYRLMNDKYFGEDCWHCGRIIHGHTSSRHEINGLKHSSEENVYAFHRERFMSLCSWCHATFHRLMEAGYSFEEILTILKWEQVCTQEDIDNNVKDFHEKES